jgi:hypothetical protein
VFAFFSSRPPYFSRPHAPFHAAGFERSFARAKTPEAMTGAAFGVLHFSGLQFVRAVPFGRHRAPHFILCSITVRHGSSVLSACSRVVVVVLMTFTHLMNGIF